jgi:hypothetical protein
LVWDFINDVRTGCEIWPTEKNVDVAQGFFFVVGAFDSFDIGCFLRFVIFLIVSHELTRSGNSTGSVDFFDCGIYQSLVDVWERRILTFNFGSIELEFDDDDVDDDEDDGIVALSFSGSSICKGICSEISLDGGIGFFNWRIRLRIAL